MITKAQYDSLTYLEQEKFQKRCYHCENKYSPFSGLKDEFGHNFCSDYCHRDFHTFDPYDLT